MSAFREDVANHYGIVADKKRIWVTDVFGNSRPQPTARVKCWLPGDESPAEVLILGRLPTNIVGLRVSVVQWVILCIVCLILLSPLLFFIGEKDGVGKVYILTL